MQTAVRYFIGVDVASTRLSVSIFDSVQKSWSQTKFFSNESSGLEQMQVYLQEQGIAVEDAVLCLEATGVYSQLLCYWSYQAGYAVSCEAPQKVSRAMHKQYKNDVIDPQQIAEYAWRYFDQLHWWQPADAVIEQISTLLKSREHFLHQKHASSNRLKALKRQQIRSELSEECLQREIEFLQQMMHQIEEQMLELLSGDAELQKSYRLLLSVVGIGFLSAVELLILQHTTIAAMNAKQLASYLGIAPHEHRSGTSVQRKTRSRRSGPSLGRRILSLAALSVQRNNPYFRAYSQRKQQQGKPKRVINNNIVNKLLKVACAVLRSAEPFREELLGAAHPARKLKTVA